MEETIEQRIDSIKKKFENLTTPEARYTHLIDLGRALLPLPDELHIPVNVVSGCQSTLYFGATERDGKLLFSAQSDALISAGLAALLIAVYSNSTPKEILLTPPVFLHELGLFTSLSPSRSNGLASIYTRMKQISLNYLK